MTDITFRYIGTYDKRKFTVRLDAVNVAIRPSSRPAVDPACPLPSALVSERSERTIERGAMLMASTIRMMVLQ
jgi:hypothetical protein